MLSTLKFVQGAVAKKDLLPALTHFCIQGGRIVGYNGRIALSSPIALDLEAKPQADLFIKAIATCTEEVALSITPAGRLAIKSGTFNAFIACTTDPYPDIRPTGQYAQPTGSILNALKRLAPFMSEDASRPFSMGVLLRDHSAFATNNIVLAEHWLGFPFPATVNVPKSTVLEILRIGEEPLGIQVDTTSITFYYEGNRWLNSVLYTTEWPEVARILDCQFKPVPAVPAMFKVLADLKPFVGKEGRVYMTPEGMLTSPTPGEGAAIALPLPGTACFHIDQLALLEPVAHYFDITAWPKPSLFYGDYIRGAIIGMRP